MDKKKLVVKSVKGIGTVRIKSVKPPKAEKGIVVKPMGENLYEIQLITPLKVYTFQYW